jgi:hypothetical protein
MFRLPDHSVPLLRQRRFSVPGQWINSKLLASLSLRTTEFATTEAPDGIVEGL